MGNCCAACRQVVIQPHGVASFSAPQPSRSSASSNNSQQRRKSSSTLQIKLRYSKQEKELMQRYLSGFVCEIPSNQHDILVVRDHWERLHMFNTEKSSGERLAPVEILFDRFFEFLFREFPAHKVLFRGSIHVQSKALNSLVGGMRSILQSDDVIANATWLAERHIKYGIRSEHFNPYGLALIHALQVTAPRMWTSQVEESWRAVYCHVCVLIITNLEKMLTGPTLPSNSGDQPQQPPRHKSTDNTSTASATSATTTTTTTTTTCAKDSPTTICMLGRRRSSDTENTNDKNFFETLPDVPRLQQCPYASTPVTTTTTTTTNSSDISAGSGGGTSR